MYKNKDVLLCYKENSNTNSSSVLPLMCFMSSLLAAVMGRHHEVAVRAEVLDVGGLGADGGDLALHPGDLEHAAGVVFQQVALKGLPASADSHHHMFVVKHLQRKRQTDFN